MSPIDRPLPVRTLCLHGKGCNAGVFRSQTETLRGLLNDIPMEYDFVNAPFQSPPAAGVGLVYEPPYYAYWQKDNLNAIENSCKWLRSYISRHGPYDMVMSFSQGAMLVASLLLLHAAEPSDEPPPFKAAIFFAGGPQLTIMDSLGYEVPKETWDRDSISRLTLDVGQNDQKSKLKWEGPSLANGEITEDELREDIAGAWTIPIPSLHVYGSTDPRYEAGVELSGLWNASRRTTYAHGGGHEIPRSQSINEDIAHLVRQLVRVM